MLITVNGILGFVVIFCTFAAMLRHHIIIILLVLGTSLNTIGQKTTSDSISVSKGDKKSKKEYVDPLHSPKKAAIWSACLPGAGQVYNKKYWKVPIVWAGIGGAIYASQFNRIEYHKWRDQYIRRIDTNLEDDYPGASTLTLQSYKDYHKKYMELSYIIAGAIYALQIIDATVDAHLMTFDISDDLSLNVRPDAYINRRLRKPTYGITLTLNFK